MKLLSTTLFITMAAAVGFAAPPLYGGFMTQGASSPLDQPLQTHAHSSSQDDSKLDRCKGIEFDAIAPNDKGITLFFKGDQLWKGFTGMPQPINNSLITVHHLDHVDAAFRMHHSDEPREHDHTFLLLDDKVFSFSNDTLDIGFPKYIKDEFPGIPDHVDAAVECPTGECAADSVIFFKGDEISHYDIKTKTVKKKQWSHLPNCTSAFRWLERYYCFHGHHFTRFHPVTGEVAEGYPKDARRYFMQCPNFGHGTHEQRNCTDPHLDAITTDDKGKSYTFIGKWYLRLDSRRDGWHAFPIVSAWKEVHSNVDDVFSYDHKLFFIKGDQVYIYKSDAHYTLIEGYPKPLKEELGIEGPVDAAFVCEGAHTLYIIQGKKMLFLDLSTSPPAVTKEAILPMDKLDAGTCGPDGVNVYVGSDFYHYENPMALAFGRIRVDPKKTPLEMMGCHH